MNERKIMMKDTQDRWIYRGYIVSKNSSKVFHKVCFVLKIYIIYTSIYIYIQ